MKLRLIIIFLLFSCSSFAQEVNYKLVSLYMYNFTKYIEWPAKDLKNNFVIGVLGESPAYTEMMKMANAKKEVGGKTIVVRKVSTVKEIEDCQMLYIPTSQSSRFKEIKDAVKSHSTLIVTEKPGMAHKGAGINLFLDEDDDNKLKFELNKGVMETSGLHVSSQLISLGILVK